MTEMTDETPNVLLLVMDTARARTVLGNEEALPHFQRIASRGTVFTRAFSTGPWTLPSHASMFTGQYTADHETHAGSTVFDPGVPSIAELLRDRDYQTVGFSNNAWISPEFGFDVGFDTFKTNLQLVDGGKRLEPIAKKRDGIFEQSTAVGKTMVQRGGLRTVINAIYAKFLRDRYDDGAWLNNWRIRRWFSSRYDHDRPFFLFVNYLEPHLEYDPPERFVSEFVPEGISHEELKDVDQDPWTYICDPSTMDERDFEVLRSLYKAELQYLDHRIGKVYDYLEEIGVLDETMLIIVGDHGENIGDHGLMDHQYCLHDTLLHVPLLVRYPAQFPSGEKCDSLVEHRDIFPSILEATGCERGDEGPVSKNSLQEAIEGGGREFVFGEYVRPQPSMEALERRVGTLPDTVKKFDRTLRSIRSTKWKLIQGSDRSTELYNVATDRAEEHDVSHANPTVVTELTSILDDEFGALETSHESPDSQMTDTTKTRLEDLGYL